MTAKTAVTLLAVIVASVVMFTSGCSKTKCVHENGGKSKAAVLPYYNFFAPQPPQGFCEKQVFGAGDLVAEPVNAGFALTTVFLGFLGVFWSRRTTMGFQFLYGLLAAYGLASVIFHSTLINGFYRIMDVSLSVTQAFIIILLFQALHLYHTETKDEAKRRERYRILTAIMTLLFTFYPGVVHVVGESSANAWVAWLTFDCLWALIAFLLILIWRRRKTWPNTPHHAKIFRLVWYAIGCCALAYGGWCIDKFVCTCEKPFAAYAALHGWWHFFMGLCLYFMITLARYFSAHEYGFNAKLKTVPRSGPVRLPFVEWEKPSDL